MVVLRKDSQRLCVQRAGNSCISAALTAAIMLFPALGVPQIEHSIASMNFAKRLLRRNAGKPTNTDKRTSKQQAFVMGMLF